MENTPTETENLIPVTIYEIPQGTKYLLIDRGGIKDVADLVQALGDSQTILVSVEEDSKILTVLQGVGYVLPEWSNPSSYVEQEHGKFPDMRQMFERLHRHEQIHALEREVIEAVKKWRRGGSTECSRELYRVVESLEQFESSQQQPE